MAVDVVVVDDVVFDVVCFFVISSVIDVLASVAVAGDAVVCTVVINAAAEIKAAVGDPFTSWMG